MTDKTSDFDELTKHAEGAKRAEDLRDQQHEIAGVETGRNARFISSANSQKSLAEKRRAEQRASDDAFYLALMNEGAFGGFIASEVFDGKSDAQIADIAAEIEAKTGLSLEEYATGIIGAKAAGRRQGESEADYKRRVVKAVAEEVIDPVTGQIKPQYANDPLAEIIQRDSTYQAIMDDVAHINLTGQNAQADAIVSEHKSAGYEAAELSGDKIEIDVYKGELRNSQDGFTDHSADKESAAAKNDSFFGSTDNTAETSKAALKEFNNKASEQLAQTTAPTNSLDVPLGGVRA